MLSVVQKYILDHHLFAPSDALLLAVSGGADSVALLLALQELGYRRLEVAHCNFHLRGTESDRDEAFVRALCERVEVPLHVQHFDTAAYAAAHRQSIEMAARELRYGWFDSLRQQQGSACVAVAHHREDQAETVLLNLLRGTGIRGLAGMRPRNGFVVRPLLPVSRADIETFLGERGQDYVTDSTNQSDLYARNRVRHQLLPLLQQINPAALDNLLLTADNMAETERMYRYCVEGFISASLDGPDSININMVLKAPSPLCVLHEILSPFGFNRAQLVDVLRCLTPNPQVGRLFRAGPNSLLIDREQLVLRTDAQPATTQPEAADADELITPCSLDDFCSQCAAQGIEASLQPVPDTFSSAAEVAYLDADRLGAAPLSLRLTRQGDTFVPFGMTGHKLVSDFLTDAKATRFHKAAQRVLLCGQEIAWVVGRRSSNLFRVDSQTRAVVVLKVM